MATGGSSFAPAIDKLNITVESASRLEVLNADEVKTATVAATGSLTVDDWNEAAALETLIVSGSGNVTSGATSTAITGGDGNDVVGVAALDYGAAGVQKIAGGAGTDTINVTASANLDAGFIASRRCADCGHRLGAQPVSGHSQRA